MQIRMADIALYSGEMQAVSPLMLMYMVSTLPVCRNSYCAICVNLGKLLSVSVLCIPTCKMEISRLSTIQSCCEALTYLYLTVYLRQNGLGKRTQILLAIIILILILTIVISIIMFCLSTKFHYSQSQGRSKGRYSYPRRLYFFIYSLIHLHLSTENLPKSEFGTRKREI